MAIVRLQPTPELGGLRQEVDRIFDSFFSEPVRRADAWTPALDLLEREDAYLVRLDLPGVERDAVTIEYRDDALVISGTRAADGRAEQERVIRHERRSGAFRRTLGFPEGVDPEAISARFALGVLEVAVPKPAKRQPTRVEISAGESTQTIEAGGGEPAASDDDRS